MDCAQVNGLEQWEGKEESNVGSRKMLLALDGSWGTRDNLSKEFRVLAPGNEAEATAFLRDLQPDVVAFDPSVAWQRDCVRRIAPDKRPALVALCDDAPGSARDLDEWLRPGASASEVSLRLQLALERARLRRQTARRAFVDSLTGLPNRRASVRGLLREVERAKRQGTRLSLVLLDLDNFKEVNERYGHPAGDQLLRKVGSAMRAVTRSPELCGRIGGDEFAMVVPGDASAAERAGRRIQEALAQLGVGVSLGIGEWSPKEQVRELYRRTDLALKRLKEARRRRRRGSRPSPAAERPGHH